jgi:hypothetical protein
VIFQTRPPCHSQLRTGLQMRCNLATDPSANDACVSSPNRRKDLNNGRGLSMLALRQNDTGVLPFHIEFLTRPLASFNPDLNQ